MGRRGRKPYEFGVAPRLLATMRMGCIYKGHPMEQAEAAELMGVSRNTWWFWETGRRGMRMDYFGRWLEVSKPYRMWDPILNDDPHRARYIEVVSLKPRPVATPAPDPSILDAAPDRVNSRINTETVQLGQAPSDLLTVPDASELERIDSETVSE